MLTPSAPSLAPRPARPTGTRDLFVRLDALVSHEVERLLVLVGPSTSALDLLAHRPKQLARLVGRNVAALGLAVLLVAWTVVGSVGVVLAGGLA